MHESQPWAHQSVGAGVKNSVVFSPFKMMTFAFLREDTQLTGYIVSRKDVSPLPSRSS